MSGKQKKRGARGCRGKCKKNRFQAESYIHFTGTEHTFIYIFISIKNNIL